MIEEYLNDEIEKLYEKARYLATTREQVLLDNELNSLIDIAKEKGSSKKYIQELILIVLNNKIKELRKVK